MIGNAATVVRVRGATTDRYGDPAGTDARVTLTGCAVAPRSSSDIDGEGRQGVIVGVTLYAPYGTDLKHTDKFEITGLGTMDDIYEADGDAGQWKSPLTSWEAGTEIALKRATG